MQSIQSRLQSRIAIRAQTITQLEAGRLESRMNGEYDDVADYNILLSLYRKAQKLDKDILSHTYWGCSHGV